MANFRTHVLGAALVMSLPAAALAASGLLHPWQALQVFFIGVVGGLLPDVDSDNSYPIQIAFTVLALVLASLTAYWLLPVLSAFALWWLWWSVVLLVRFPLFYFFTRFTRHRGVIHSIPMALVLGLSLAWALYHSGSSALFAWLAGLALSLGFLLHLLLDELYAVDLLNRRLKRSFGSALKWWQKNNPWASALLYLALLPLFWAAPPWPADLFAALQQSFQRFF
jgi:hypothetical protein